MLTRGQVAKRIGRSIATVRRMEGASLNPTLSARGVRLFDELEVDRVAQDIARSGKALDGSPMIAAQRDHPTWVQYDELQGEFARMEAKVLDAEIEVDDLREQLDELQREANDLREKLLHADNAQQVATFNREKWISEINEACGLLLSQVEEPNTSTVLIVNAISDLLNEV